MVSFTAMLSTPFLLTAVASTLMNASGYTCEGGGLQLSGLTHSPKSSSSPRGESFSLSPTLPEFAWVPRNASTPFSPSM